MRNRKHTVLAESEESSSTTGAQVSGEEKMPYLGNWLFKSKAIGSKKCLKLLVKSLLLNGLIDSFVCLFLPPLHCSHLSLVVVQKSDNMGFSRA
jgi:hypothetical protein